ncbi:hypothetical protein GQ55_2G466000 [Panicum hallii var. hallii]|uniref:DUF7595 domain-containing protein n=1 Tax=Panicum hallii var. hallii TaxID=1504633 RepID=A0A2T7EZS0_9POAL|nr:hypothetical protein GQ55_2G466000 [Panicum hallii var. hallii]
MAGGGDVPRPPAQAAPRGRRRKHQTPSLPLDIVLEIAARSDPATLVRCAATCAEARRRVAGGGGQALRLRHADRFVPSLLRGHLEARYVSNYCNMMLHLVDTTAPDTTTARVLTAADGFPPPPDGTNVRLQCPMASRDGLLLVRITDWQPRREELRVCDLATGRSQTLPPGPAFPGVAQKCWEPYVLLAGDGEPGGASGIRPFQVLKTNLVMSDHHRYLETQTFSSEKGAWGKYTVIRAPHFRGSALLRRGGRPLVAGGAVHWLCVTNSGGYVLKLHIRTAQVAVTALPVSFPCPAAHEWGIDYLLATTAAGGEVMVLVADSWKKKNISAWVQTKPTAKWTQRPQVVMENEAMLRFRNMRWSGTFHVKLHWFAERSGFVLLSSNLYGEFWLDLRSMEIVRWCPGAPDQHGARSLPYEMDLSSWVPTFSSTI